MKHNVSRVMSTQHPDNVRQPFFSDKKVLEGDDEVKEAFYAYSHLDCREQLWDCEGKEVDAFVVKKLFSSYEPYFRKHKLGKDVFLTLRVPNPSIERNEAKILLETLESIPRNYDIAKIFYEGDIPPIFEVCQPMTSDAKELLRISRYYKNFIIGRRQASVFKNDITIAQWIGDFKPSSLRITPLFETKESMLNAHKITEEYMKKEKIGKSERLQRVWLARSDPALNYGNVSAMLLSKVALQRLQLLSEKTSVDILPILGCGSAPFRGNLKPSTVANVLAAYPSVQTFTVQSAFKYDHPEREVADAVKMLNETTIKKSVVVDEVRCEKIIEKVSAEYTKQVKLIAPIVNEFTQYIPSRRKRKLHVGLFGYSRASAGVRLPRAIPFCASLYSLGLPPELLGLNVLTPQEIDYLRTIHPSFDDELRSAIQYLNKNSLSHFPAELVKRLRPVFDIIPYETDRGHEKVTGIIVDDLKQGNTKVIEENVVRAGWIRGFLG